MRQFMLRSRVMAHGAYARSLLIVEHGDIMFNLYQTAVFVFEVRAYSC